MDRPYYRDQLLKYKSIVRNLYSQNQVSKTLSHASDDAVDFLLRFLYFIVNGHVPLSAKANEAIAKSLRASKLSLFESRKYLKDLLKKNREEKLQVLKQFNKLYSDLFFYVFNLK